MSKTVLGSEIRESFHYNFQGVGRAVGGAVIFNLPLLMTMEMWWIAQYITPGRLVGLIAFSLPLFLGVSRVIGFRDNRNLIDNLIDIFVAYAFGFAISALSLYCFSTLSTNLTAGIHLNAITLLAIPATLGALLGRSEIGSGEHNPESFKSYPEEVVILTVGALFIALAVAPTEEIRLIAQQMSDWHRLGLFILTIAVMLTFSIIGGYSRSPSSKRTTRIISLCGFCGTAYLASLLCCLFLLWVFGQLQTMGYDQLVSMLVVLLFPSGIGAAAAKLII